MIYYIIDKIRHMLFSLRFSILSIFISLFVITTFLIIYLSSIAFSDELLYTSTTLMRHVSDLVMNELSAGLRPIQRAGKLSAELIKTGVIQTDQVELVPYTYSLVDTVPLVQGAYWGDENGNCVYSKREPDKTITSEIFIKTNTAVQHITYRRNRNGNIIKREFSPNISYDPRTRPWYIEAKNQKKAIWTDIYKSTSGNPTVISVGTPVFNDESKLVGVFGLDMTVDFLKKFVSDINVSPNGYSFIITMNEDLIAYPNRAPFNDFISKPGELMNTHKLSIPLIDKSIDMYKKNGLYEFEMQYNNENYLVTFHLVPDLASHGWLIGVITPTSDFISFLEKVDWITAIVSFFTLLLGVLIVSSLITRIVKPIKELVKETERIRKFELEGKVNIRSRIKEVIILRNSINYMKLGLKQFQRYVPKILVRQLIESGQDVYAGGVRKELVVLFTDIENFTTIAEHMDPNQLMADVCEYLEIVTQVILSEKGTLDKYIGDSTMAFWGAPIEEDHPFERAAAAALQCQQSINQFNEKREWQGKPRFNTRIGIHAGEAIVGNLGSTERLSYTALGDTINITSRLENINKEYGTSIMVSEVVYKEIKDKFVLRLVDFVNVKGRSRGLNIYELIGDDINKISFDLPAYREEFDKAFIAFKNYEWDDAISYFQACLKIYPADSLARKYIERCKKLRLKH